MTQSRHITIIGGGLAGPLLACLLADAGHEVTVLERRGDPRAAGYEGGRSINLALSARGLEALDRIGLKQVVLDTVVPMRGRMMHDEKCNTAYSPYSHVPGEAINSVSRGGLNCMVLDAAQSRSGITLAFDVDCTDIDVETATVTFVAGDAPPRTLAADLIVGADGAGSMVRQAMHDASPIDDGTEFIDSGYKELTIPAAEDGSFQLESHALHIWPRGHYMMIALPNGDGSFTCTCFWPIEGPDSFSSVDSPESIRTFFCSHFPDAAALMPGLVEEYTDNPVGLLGTVRCNCYHHEGTAVLIGDAAHAIVPFFGQGMNAAFQDCLRLASCLAAHDDLPTALRDYDSTQRPDGDAIAALSLSNFIEMRNKTASPFFRCLQRIRKQLSMNFPNWYMPRYNLVSFTTVPYADVMRQVARRRITFPLVALGATGICALFVLVLLGII
ncbi:MAG: NAD(P)/FAD-dependent oxidoreductase [Phycisphaerales bacterium]|nr:NAD(P)/FAD-dependent oxidoreductase [Phycisphaerales bacterium]